MTRAEGFGMMIKVSPGQQPGKEQVGPSGRRQGEAEDSIQGVLSLLPSLKGTVHIAFVMRQGSRWVGEGPSQCSEIGECQPSRQRQPAKLPTKPVRPRSKRNTESRYNHIVLLLITKDVK